MDDFDENYDWWNPPHPFLMKYQGKLLRMWQLETLTSHRDGNTATWKEGKDTCIYVYVTDMWDMGSGRWMVEYHEYDDQYEDKMTPTADFDYFDEVKFQYVPGDSE
jgi:hypothetical protein